MMIIAARQVAGYCGNIKPKGLTLISQKIITPPRFVYETEREGPVARGLPTGETNIICHRAPLIGTRLTATCDRDEKKGKHGT